MTKLLACTENYYGHLARGLSGLGPVVLLLFRVWVALAFWRAVR